MSGARLGALEPGHRARVHEILVASGAFSAEEIEVALELFDSGLATRDSGLGEPAHSRRAGAAGTITSLEPLAPSPDYELLGSFDEAGSLTGYACFGPTPGTDRTFDLYWIAVHPAAQSTGEGARLLEAVERTLAARSARLLVVETSSRDDYARTRRFYERRGYGEAARLHDFYAPADDRVIYIKRLTSPASTSQQSERGVTR